MAGGSDQHVYLGLHIHRSFTPGVQTGFDRTGSFRSADGYRFRPGVFARGQSFSTQVLTGCGGGLSGFACTFFGLARGIGVTRFYLFFPSFIESDSASSHENILLLLLYH
jgi:hypothetical protein